jgi:hypothetical protein
VSFCDKKVVSDVLFRKGKSQLQKFVNFLNSQKTRKKILPPKQKAETFLPQKYCFLLAYSHEAKVRSHSSETMNRQKKGLEEKGFSNITMSCSYRAVCV